MEFVTDEYRDFFTSVTACSDSDQPSKLVLTWASRDGGEDFETLPAFIVMRRASGILLCTPPGALPESWLLDGLHDPLPEDAAVGPSTGPIVAFAGVRGIALASRCPVLLVDIGLHVESEVGHALSIAGDDAVYSNFWVPESGHAAFSRGVARWPHAGHLVNAAQSWAGGDAGERGQAYLTADEGPEEPRDDDVFDEVVAVDAQESDAGAADLEPERLPGLPLRAAFRDARVPAPPREEPLHAGATRPLARHGSFGTQPKA